MEELVVQRRLVKSPPELWAEISDADALGRHLDLFGEIRISRVEPESTVAWEGERASGTVVLDSTGWGTKVTLTAEMREPAMPEPATESTAGGSAPLATDTVGEAGDTTPVAANEQAGGPAADPAGTAPGRAEPPTADPTPEPAPVSVPASAAAPPPPRARRGLFARLFGRRTPVTGESHRQPEPEPEPELARPEVEEATPPPVAPEPELAAAPVEPLPDPEPVEPAEPELDVQTALTALEGVLDTLGAAHHRPFSR